MAILLFVTLNIDLINSNSHILEYSECCVNANDGSKCVSVSSNNCASGYAPQSCSQISDCQKGVCINTQSGECTENTPKSVCETSGGLFKTDEIHNIPECNTGCCILGGDNPVFSTEVACREIASKNGLDFTFRGDITNSNTCLALDFLKQEGACVIKTGFETKCKRTLGSECGQGDSGSFTSLLDKYVSGTSITTEFHAGKLCTADELKTDCVKSQKTTCYKDDVYYLDTCGNRANVFDSGKYSVGADKPYWTEIQNPSEVCSNVVGGSNAAKTCGNCDYSSSSKCRSPQSEDPFPLNQKANFENVCGDLRCEYNGETYQNTESWCAQTPGTPWETSGPGIELALNGSLITDKDKLFNPEKYNLPGSRYVVQTCSEGEILQTECKDQREQVCKQWEQEGRTRAECFENNYKSCFFLEEENKDSCNDIDDCYWLSGSSPIIGGHADEGATRVVTKEEVEKEGLNAGKFPDDEREQKQGTCVPLFSPGTNFWEELGQAHCLPFSDQRRVLYELGSVGESRENLMSQSETIGGKYSYGGDTATGKYKRQSDCLFNCFAIPNYGGVAGESLDGLVKLWKGEKWDVDWGGGGKPVSDRKGQYCHKKSDKNSPKSGPVSDKKVDCIEDDEGKEYNKPEFYTHSSWLKFIGLRARASGDCGVTNNFLGENPDYSSEKITTFIQKIKQDQTSTKEKWEGSEVEGILYTGEDLADLSNPKFRGSIYPGTVAEMFKSE